MDESRRKLVKQAAVGTGIVWAAPVLRTSAAYGQAGTPGPTPSTTPTTTPGLCFFPDAPLDAAQEVPPNPSIGQGTALINLAAGRELCVVVTFERLSSPAIAAHIHGPAAPGVNAAILFPLTDVPAAISGDIPPQCFTVDDAQHDQLCAGLFYVNIHSQNFPGGEIRGQIETT